MVQRTMSNMCAGHSRSSECSTRPPPKITIQMLRAGQDVLAKFDRDEDEDTSLVAAIYWAMAEASHRRR